MHAISILVHFETIRSFDFDPVRTIEDSPLVEFRTVHQSRDHELFDISLLIHTNSFKMDQKRYFEQFESGSKVKFEFEVGTKSKRHAYVTHMICVT